MVGNCVDIICTGMCRYYTDGDVICNGVDMVDTCGTAVCNCIDMVYFPFTLKRTTGAVFKIFENEKGMLTIFLSGLIDFTMVCMW